MGALTDGDDDANTPLDHDALTGLIPSWVATRADLNEAEAGNVASGLIWLANRHPAIGVMCTSGFVRELHRQLFGDVWKWAGQFRTTDLNIGVEWWAVTEAIEQLVSNFAVRLAELSTVSIDADLVDLHHRMVSIHPFVNGNGRHARALADAAALAAGRPFFTWGSGSIPSVGTVRSAYLAALRTADEGDLEPLLRFARS